MDSTQILVKGSTIFIRNLSPAHASVITDGFSGQKLGHFWKLEMDKAFAAAAADAGSSSTGGANHTQDERVKWYTGKPIFYRGTVNDDFTEEMLKTAIFTLKIDGRCACIRIDDGHPVLYVRHDARLTEEGMKRYENGEKVEYPRDFKPVPGGIPCSDEAEARHFPLQRPMNKGDKWEMEAFKKTIDHIPEEELVAGTVEVMGLKIGKNPEKFERQGIIYHASIVFEIPDELRTFEGVREILKVFDIEGFVCYDKVSGKIFKIRKDCFEGMKFPDLNGVRVPVSLM